MIKKVVLAYSGGLDTSVMISWLKENYNCDVIAFAADLGQEKELTGLKEKAMKTGASKIYIEDLKREFAEDFLVPMIKSGAVYEGHYLLGTSVARPLIAKKQIEIAKREKADAVAHGATGKGNDQVRFELTYKALAPDMRIIAPWREWEIKGRQEAIEYAKKRRIPVPVTKDKPYSSDRNLWHISYEGGILEDPWFEPQENMFKLTASPKRAPDKPEYVEIEFEKGEPKTLNGKRLTALALIQQLNKIGGKNAIGRVDIVENRLVGMKSRGVYETPGGTILYAAHQTLESITLDKDVQHYKQLVAQRYAELIYNGQWYTPLKESLDAFINKTQETVSGTVRLKLYKGNCNVVGRKSHKSLYRPDLATFEKEEIYNQKDAEGFINLFGLPIKVRAKLEG
ncbi:argininosuccinate synthase [candidate division WOR-1 bacterium RIFCSPLOWO2_02_FULL_46_20]|uniref:Argininosuccinate synthase n=1 Tax=candidate division WOR-1 bacterium RIFCSPLOWO2_02_FULL_46_20 TaxID=1802567 RepID=A0A1F4RES5_UNCSA|nr:MAG: argininosuccinate synthase [candidate division WOR-1 bacterium RIFCSPHIGHO2_02_FULL_45_12]OGC06648.1 MAG: argininosuccinate synthase [candidate division WOR-1 bacterium RIFCSPLOWO2_02_FULL_46_20]